MHSRSVSPKVKPEPKRSRSPRENQGEGRKRVALPEGGRTGGVYIPPFKLARMRQGEIEKGSEADQRQHWEALKKSINGFVNKANAYNIPVLVEEMFRENLIRGRGLVARAILRAQMASPGFTHIFAGLLAVINSRLPEVGQLLITRLILQFRRAYKNNDKIVCLACLKFIAHLVNQRVLSEIIALEVCSLLLEQPTNDGVEVCCQFLQECGQALDDLQPKGLAYIFERLRAILNEGEVDTRSQYIIEKLFEVRRKKFEDFPATLPELDLIDEDDQQTHMVDLLDDSLAHQELLDIFKAVPSEQWEDEERKWKEISKSILGEAEGEDSSGENDEDGSIDSEEEADRAELVAKTKILDYTEQDLINLRKTVYLCIMSSAGYEECVHKLLKLNIREGQEIEVCTMLIDCCSMERTFSRFFALQAERLCLLRETYVKLFAECFQKQYLTVRYSPVIESLS